MKKYTHKIGAVMYILWGLLHIVGAGLLLQQLSSEGVVGVLASLGSAVPAAELPDVSGGVVGAVLAFHSWNLLWIGLLVVVVGLRLNWTNRPIGYWLNAVVVGAADIGLIVTLLVPGYMTWSDGWPGPVLWFLAVVFSTIGLLQKPAREVEPAELATA